LLVDLRNRSSSLVRTGHDRSHRLVAFVILVVIDLCCSSTRAIVVDVDFHRSSMVCGGTLNVENDLHHDKDGIQAEAL